MIAISVCSRHCRTPDLHARRRHATVRASALSVVALLVSLLATPLAAGPSLTPDDTLWITNGPVYDIVREGPLLYLGGRFTYIGPNTGFGAPIDSATREAIPGFARPNDRVFAAAGDGAGGWYIGGLFTQVGRTPRRHLAHLLPDGTVDPDWAPEPEGPVFALAVSGTTVYVGGDFQFIGAASRHHVAALDAATGLARLWVCDTNDTVRAITAFGEDVFIGGEFSEARGAARHGIACARSATGTLMDWAPGATGSKVRAIAVSGTTVYVGGTFSLMAGLPRAGVAAIHAHSGLATPWNPGLGVTNALAATESKVFVGTAAGVVHSVDAATGASTPVLTVPNFNWALSGGSPSIHTFALVGTTLYVGGSLRDNDWADEDSIVVIDAEGDGDVIGEIPTSGRVHVLAASGEHVYAGGTFGSVGGVRRSGVAAIDLTTNRPTALSADVTLYETSYVFDVAVSGRTLFLGGRNLLMVGGQPRLNLASVDVTTGTVTGWNPQASDNVTSLLADAEKVYVGGKFTYIEGVQCRGLAVFDVASGVRREEFPVIDGVILDLARVGTTLYLAGSFSAVGGVPRKHLAAIDTTTGALTAWDPSAGASVTALALGRETVFAAGDFSTVGGVARAGLAELSRLTGEVTPWAPAALGSVRSIATSGSSLFVGGHWISFDRQLGGPVVELDLATAAPTEWSVLTTLRETPHLWSPIPFVATPGVPGRPSSTSDHPLDVGGNAADGGSDPQPRDGVTPRHPVTVEYLFADESQLYMGGFFSAADDLPIWCLARFERHAPRGCFVVR